MINQTRLLNLFSDLVAIDNPSLKEREMCDKIKEILNSLGIESHEDDTAAKIGGDTGNLYAYIDGTLELPPILLSAHMDAVDPACGKKAVFHSDGTITSDGTTVLGADDLSGVATILEVLTVLKENGIPHRPIEVLFDVSEETYCTGIKQFDSSRLRSKEAYVFDLSGPVGNAANQAPSIVSFRADFHGRAAHAAFSPENGIHAIKAASAAISSIDCGRVEDVTINIGTVHGGSADNIVPEYCSITGEIRGFNDSSVKRHLSKVEEIIRKAAEQADAEVSFSTETLSVAYYVEPTDPVALRFQKACLSLGLPGSLVNTYGGSDNNIFYHQGIRGLVVASGMNNCHSCKEYTSVSELANAAELILALVLSKE